MQKIHHHRAYKYVYSKVKKEYYTMIHNENFFVRESARELLEILQWAIV